MDDDIAAAQQRLAEIRMKAGSAYEAHDNAALQLAKLDDEIAATGEELAAAQDELKAAEGELQERAAQMYKSGNVGFVDVLVGAEDFSEFANRLELWMDLIIQERDEFDRVREARDALAQKKADLEAQRDKRAAALADADAQIDRASGLEADAQAYLDSLNAELREAMEAEQARQVQHAEEEAAQHAEEEALAIRRAPMIESGAEEESAPALAPVRNSVDQALADRRAEREAAEAYAAEKAAEAEQARLAALAAEGEEAAEDAEAMLAAAEAAERRAAIAEERAADRAAAEEAAAQEAEELAAAQEQYAADQAALDAAEQQYADGQEDTGGETTGSGGQYAGGNQYGSGPTTGAAGAQPSSTGGGGGPSSCADDFGGVQPHVAQIGCDLQDRFGLRITGIGYSDYHWDGLDLDIWTSSVTLGNQVRDYALANYAVEYTCWQDRYVNVLTGWEEGCAGHMDHVHITFRP